MPYTQLPRITYIFWKEHRVSKNMALVCSATTLNDGLAEEKSVMHILQMDHCI